MSLPKELSQAVFRRDKFSCRHCRERRLHPHHIIFRSQGGSDDMRNLISLCPECHDAVHGGKLRIVILEVLENDVVVRFERLKGWKPKG